MTRTTKPPIAYILSIAAMLVCFSAGAAAQTLTPETPTAAPAPAKPETPPPAAVILKLRQDLLDRDSLIVQLQAQIYQLQAMILEADKTAQMPGIVKDAGGKPGDAYDLKRLALMPAQAPAPATQTPPPDATRKP